jgi:hypothetical protein
MKKITVTIFTLFLLTVMLSGQVHKTITVKAGTRIVDYFAQDEMYRYPEFTQGKISFKDGTATVTKLNYSILVGEMQFIASGDTMAVANEKDIRYVQIMLDTFYYDNGYLEVIAGHDPVLMAVKRYVKVADIKKEGPMGTRSSGTGAQTYSGIYDIGIMSNHSLVMQEDLVLSQNTDYYIGNAAAGFLVYKKNNVKKLFPKHKSAIEKYLKTNAVDFNVKEDLVKLTEFLKQLN